MEDLRVVEHGIDDVLRVEPVARRIELGAGLALGSARAGGTLGGLAPLGKLALGEPFGGRSVLDVSLPRIRMRGRGLC